MMHCNYPCRSMPSNTSRNYAVYLAEQMSGQGKISSTHTHAKQRQNDSPVVIVWRRGNSLAVCIGSTGGSNNIDVRFHKDFSRARRFDNSRAAFDWLREYFNRDQIVKRMIENGKFHVVELEQFTALNLSDETGINALLGDSPVGQPPTAAA